MDNNNLQQIKQLVDNSRNIAIAVGTQAGMDEMGAALGLYLTLMYANKQVSVASPVEPTVAISSLVGIDKVKKGFESGTNGDLVVSFPYREGEIEKVSYTIDNGFLNIVVKAGEQGLAFDERDVLFKRGGTGGGASPDLMFVIGTPRLSDLGNLFNPEALKDTRIVNIDNKSDNQGFGDIVLVSPQFSSVSEQVADLIMGLGLEMDLDISQNLMSGIASATENFQSSLTSSLAFEMAGVLMRKGAIRERVSPVSPRDAYQPAPASSSFTQGFGAMPQPQRAQRPMTQPQQMPQQMPQPQMRQSTQMPQRPMPQPQQSMPQQPFGAPQPQMPQDAPQNDDTPPSDWLTPKVYKGSTSV